MKKIGLTKAVSLTKKADKMTSEERSVLQKERLKNLIAYAKANSPYFTELYKGINENSDITKFPPTNKKEMMEHFDEWFTDRSVTRVKVDEFMSDLSNVGKKLNGKYLVYTTSGSTGMPCIVLYDDNANNVSAAIGAVRSFARKEDFKAFMKHGGRTLALFADNGFYLASGSVRYNINRMPWKKKQMKTFEVRKPTPEIVKALNEYQPSMIGCYPTALELLASEQEKGNLHISPVIIMTGGEKLTDDIREHLSKVFNCYVQTNYSCTEGGTVACECTEKHFHINDDWVIVEAVDENNNPVPFGTQSAKILLTNLANRICPIIRFEITDRVVIHNESCPCGCNKAWLTLEGRTDDILIFKNGVKISPFSLYAVMKEVHGANRFQLIQEDDDGLSLRLIADDREGCFNQAKNDIERYLKANGVDTIVTLSQELPKASEISGKYKHVIAKKINR